MSKKTENKDYTPAVGKRKCAVARVRILKQASKGINIIINDKDYKAYLPIIYKIDFDSLESVNQDH
jgi:ribosomal protein S9